MEQEKKKKRLSPFSREFWVQKGYTIEQADYKRNSFRPIRKEYWLEKGYKENEAIELAKKTKDENNKKGGKVAASAPKDQIRKRSPRCIEYWLEKGYNTEDAKQKLKEYQTTFSLEKCIKKYGNDRGKQIWEARQQRWQSTLKDKTEEEISKLNKSKSSIDYDRYIKRGYSHKQIIDELYKLRKIELVDNIDDFHEKIKNDILQNPYIAYRTPKQIMKLYQKMQIRMLNIDETFFNKYSKHSVFLKTTGKKRGFQLHTEQGLLRSLFEIEFYNICKKYNVEFEIDNKYPNSNFRYDFYFPKYDIYIEICPLYETKYNEKYTEKMNMKKKIFGCYLLKDPLEYEIFVKRLVDNESEVD